MSHRRRALFVVIVMVASGPMSPAVEAQEHPLESLEALSPAEAAGQVFQRGSGSLAVDTGRQVTGADVARSGLEIAGPGMGFWFRRYGYGRPAVHRVGPSYRFCHGDKVDFQLESNRNVQVVVLSRSLSGEPGAFVEDRSGGVAAIRAVVGDQGTTHSSSWRILLSDHGRGVPLRKGAAVTIPSREAIVLGEEPGTLHLVVIASEEAIRLDDTFDVTSGRLRAEVGSSEAGSLAGLNASLKRWSGNTVLAPAQPGRAESYALGVDPAMSIAFELTLDHYSCSRRISLPSLHAAAPSP